VLGHLVGHGVGIFEALGDGRDAAGSSYKRQGEGGDFAGITIGAGEQGGDLIGGVMLLEMAQQAFQVTGLQKRLDRVYKRAGVYRC
jgi:hypothetical protein